MMVLLDVGVWLAAAWSRHRRHPEVTEWFEAQTDHLGLCRVTQMGLLRLMTNSAVTDGDAVSRDVAWRLVDQFREDERVRWLPEPIHLEPAWRAISARRDGSHKLWTDDYLAAFAQVSGCSLATLDKQFAARYPSVDVVVIS